MGLTRHCEGGAPRQFFLLKAGEIYLKGGNRRTFERLLAGNLRSALDGVPGVEVRGGGGKFEVSGAGHDPGVFRRIARVFGVVEIDLAFGVETDRRTVETTAVALARSAAGGSGGAARTFRISARRSWKQFELTSQQLNSEVGALVQRETGMGVDLERPDIDVRIEVGPHETHLYAGRVAGAGGLPVGGSGRALLLLSGGIDSPVAGWLGMRRGLRVDAIHFHSPPYTGPAALRKVGDLAGVLAEWQGAIRLNVVGFTKAQEIVRTCTREEYRVIMYRRLMMRIASRVAASSGADAILTGESLGQVASQTLENIACVEDASDLTVLRPLVTYDKSEIVSRARTLGTYEISIRQGEDCCSLFVPRHPVTKGKLLACEREERRFDVASVVDACVASVEPQVVRRSG